MQLRDYQLEAKRQVLDHWQTGIDKTLLILPTGTGKTIVFSSITEEVVRNGGRVLILAHREELLNQAADKLQRATGLGCAVEKADSYGHDTWFNVVVGSVQTMQRLDRRDKHKFTHIIVDEAHHSVSQSYRAVIDHFPDAKLLGVTATADRGDKRNLGELYETIAYEYSLPKAIRAGHLCQIKALTIPLQIEMDGVKTTAGDFQAAAVGNAIDPYLEQIAGHVKEHCQDRKTIVFLPLIATSQKFLSLLQEQGMDAREVNGSSEDRAETLRWFSEPVKGRVLCNAMLLTEGYDQPDVDCICMLRPTKMRGLYCQCIGRGTRPAPGKDDLLLLDFLWHSERHELCRPAHLVCENPDISKRVAELMAENMEEVDLLGGVTDAENSAQEEREETLRKMLEEQKHKRKALVDPLQYEMSVDAQVKEYVPTELKDMGPPSTAQIAMLEKFGIDPTDVTCNGHASKLIDTLLKRRAEGYTTPKQIRLLERYGFENVGQWQFDKANNMITRIAANNWQVPRQITPREYTP